ncbi:MAG: hypothetical protein CMF48_02330 [Legionellales bacterium]|nr:hypothetical protein [Legionellales bacterium]|tara:strand:- start:240 stop:830 length:591 start_codon:yes stop_codon:yes gene_type:complete
MHHQLKERLFGGVVIVALAIVFIPMLFDQSIPKEVSPYSSLPEAPDWSEENDITVPEHWIASEQESQDKDKTVIYNLAKNRIRTTDLNEQPQNNVPASPTHEAAKQKIEPEAVIRKVWAIQLASFNEADNAEDLAQELRMNGYPAYTTKAKQADKETMRVMVGPEIDKREAQNLKSVLKTRFNLEGIVVPYDPVSG